MREVFNRKNQADPGRVFYTITRDDVWGNSAVVQTEIGPIYIRQVLGRLTPNDVGRRMYRVPGNDERYWYWQAENDKQRAARLEGKLQP